MDIVQPGERDTYWETIEEALGEHLGFVSSNDVFAGI